MQNEAEGWILVLAVEILVSVKILLVFAHGNCEGGAQKWRDEYVQWSPADYGGIVKIEVDVSRLWHPNLLEMKKSAR